MIDPLLLLAIALLCLAGAALDWERIMDRGRWPDDAWKFNLWRPK